MERAEFLELVDGHLAGTLSAEQHSALEGVLQAQPQSRLLLLTAVSHEILLRQYAFEQLDAAAAPTRPDPQVRHRPAAAAAPAWKRGATRFRWPQIRAVALFLLGLGLLVAVEVMSRSPAPGAHLAHLVTVLSAGDGDSGTLLRAGAPAQPLRPGLALDDRDRIALPHGASAALRFDQEETTLSLGGGGELGLGRGGAGLQLALAHGSLTAAVAHQAAGSRLTITTPEAAIAVIGTRLTVSSGAAQTTVAVDEGRVRVQRGADAAEVGAGQLLVAAAGRPLVAAPTPELRWDDRRPLGLMMLCTAATGWAGNPRGWFNDAALAAAGPAGAAAFARRGDEVIEQTIGILRAMDAQGVVFWDLEGREHALGYVGDPRLLARMAPEMEAFSDRMFARLRAAGFAVGMAVRTQEVVLGGEGGAPARLQAVSDPERQVAAKIEYARTRWGATIFPLLGASSGELRMAELCRRVLAAEPGILLMPVADDAEAYRWSAPWQDPASPPALTPAAARARLPGAFGVLKTLERADLERQRDQLVQAVAAGDILTFRAWYPDPTQGQLKAIIAAGAAARGQPAGPPPR
jgi:hypothetical protein